MSEGETRDKSKFRRVRCAGVLLTIVITVGVIILYKTVHHRLSSSAIPAKNIPMDITISNFTVARRVPDFIIIGAKKCGTKALITMLNTHPRIVAAKGEVHFFNRDERYQNKGMSWYINRMPLSRRDQLVVEKTPNYFVNPNVPSRMVESLSSKSLKLVLIVRDPIVRAVSDYAQLDAKRTQQNKQRKSFEWFAFDNRGEVKTTATSVIRDSMYDIHYQRWLKYFHPSQILILDGDQLITNPTKELVKVESYLKIEPYFTPSMFYFNETKGFYCWKSVITGVPKCLGKNKGRKHQELSPDVKEKLKEFFEPHMANFCKMSGISFTFCPTTLHSR